MARKPKYDGGTKNKIIEVATAKFFRKGYDGTSIRGITDEIGCEVGLFYYYYKCKDDLFSDVMDNFFAPYKVDFERLALAAEVKPYQALLHFFEYMLDKTAEFRGRYASVMHRTTRWAIREQTLTVIEPYIERIIVSLKRFGAKPLMDDRTAAVFLSHGVGSLILHESTEWVLDANASVRQTVNLILGLDDEVSAKMRRCGADVDVGENL